jgi:hypothetical protein
MNSINMPNNTNQYFLNCPDFSERKFGIEIEFLTHTKVDGRSRQLYHGTVVSALIANGIACVYEDYNHTTRTYWKLTTDSSCGWELVSPPLSGVAGLEEVAKVCNVLEKTLHINVDKSCGLHVHVDASELTMEDIKNVVLRYAKNEKIIDYFMPKSRREDNNDFCLSLEDALTNTEFLKSKTIQSLSRNMDNGRYSKINLESYLRYGTIEFRQHNGTVNDEKICNWIKFCVQFVEATKVLTTQVSENNIQTQRPRNTNPSPRLIKLANHLASWSNCSINLEPAAQRSGYKISSLSSALKKLEKDYNWECAIVTTHNNKKKISVYHIGIMPDQETEQQKNVRLMKYTSMVGDNDTFNKFKDIENIYFNIDDSVSEFLTKRSEAFKETTEARRSTRQREQERRREEQEARRTNLASSNTQNFTQTITVTSPPRPWEAVSSFIMNRTREPSSTSSSDSLRTAIFNLQDIVSYRRDED